MGLQLIASDSSPGSQLTRKELASQVRKAIDQLKDEDREMILMRVYDGLSNAESAEVLRIEPGSASKRYGRALLRLRALLLAEDIHDS